MNFEISERMQTVLAMIDEFLHKELYPLEPGAPLMSGRELERELHAKRKKVKQMGLWAPNHPEEYGGMGLGLVDHGLVSEALGGSPFGHYVFGCQAPDAGNIEILHLYGTEQQKMTYLRPLVAGDIRSCFSMTEVEMPGSNPVMLETTAVKDGDDYVINGQKWYTTAADGAEFAVVMAVTDPDPPGFDLVRNINVMGHVGEGFFSHAEILYHSCRVPQSNRLGPEGHGFIIAQERLGPGRIHHCMRWLGVCHRAFQLMCERAMSRTIAPGTTLADKDIIRSWISECAADIRAARLLTLHTAWTIEKYGWQEARQEISMIKFLVAKTMLDVLDRALQVHGGLGMTDDTVLAWFWRHERGSRIYDGADEVHKISLAKRILRDIEKHGRWKL
jgi:alkylation response protein AidB-like acyl-CoA dehydrogenase